MNFTTIRDAVKEVLLTVDGVSVVQSFPRLDPNNHIQRFAKLYNDGTRLNGWTIQRLSSFNKFLTSKEVQVQPSILLIGILQHNDQAESQDEFDDLVDAVMYKFFANYRLGDVDIQGPAQLQIEELRQVANTVVHYCEITLKTVHRERID